MTMLPTWLVSASFAALLLQKLESRESAVQLAAQAPPSLRRSTMTLLLASLRLLLEPVRLALRLQEALMQQLVVLLLLLLLWLVLLALPWMSHHRLLPLPRVRRRTLVRKGQTAKAPRPGHLRRLRGAGQSPDLAAAAAPPPTQNAPSGQVPGHHRHHRR
jgi:hypothetical protein